MAGTFVILGCQAFICFLWIGGSGNSLWLDIVLAGWIPRSITIAALLIRSLVTAQAAICTSMLAALVLEIVGTPLRNAAAISMARFEITGPLSLLLLFRRPINNKDFLLKGIVLLLATSTFLLQFTSTVLLSGIGLDVIPITQLRPNISYGISDETFVKIQTRHLPGYTSTTPRYPAFAEYSERSSVEDGVDDTGLSIRAFLPITPETSRDIVKNYTGMATLFDTRVVCMRPEVSEIQIEMSMIPGWSRLNLTGRIGTNMTAPRFHKTSQPNGSTLDPFNCTYAIRSPSMSALYSTATYAELNEWPLALCGLDMTEIGIISEMSSLEPRGFNNAFIVVNTTAGFGDLRDTTYLNISFQEPRGEWLILHTNDTRLSFTLSLCFSDVETQDASIQAWRSTDSNIEAVSSWDHNTSTFDTFAPRRQLGATVNKDTLTPSDRGIFSLRAMSSWLKEEGPDNPKFTVPEQILNGVFADLPFGGHSVALCSFCWGPSSIINMEYSAVFLDILKDTQSPALAIQAFLTTLIGMSYYDSIVQFDYEASGTIVLNTSVLKPTGWKYFIIVLAVTIIHLFLVALVMILFVMRSKYSLIGSAWSAIAQVRSPEIEVWIERAEKKNDRAVEKILNATGRGDILVGVGDIGYRRRLISKEAGDNNDYIQLTTRYL